MPTKTTRGGHLKSHNRSASASTQALGKHATTGTGGATAYPHLGSNANIIRTKSAEKIKRVGSDLQPLLHVKNVLPYTAYQQHPVHQTQSNHVAGYQNKKRGIAVIEAQTNDDGDDDEWVSSESGAVTPADNDEEDGPPTPTDTISMIHHQQQLPPEIPTNNPPDSDAISKVAANVDTDRNPMNALHNKSRLPNVHAHAKVDADADADMTSHIQNTRSVLPHLQFPTQAQLHPMTRTQATSATGVKQRTAVGPPPLTTRRSSGLTIQADSSNVVAEETRKPAENHVGNESTRATTSATGSDQASHPQPQVRSTEQPATPRVGITPLRPISSEASHSETHRRPQARQRPQSMADIRLINTNVKAANEEADDTFIESPATELPPSRTRPPSTRSMRSIYHHPLIRTRSYAPSTPTLTAPPAFSPTTASPTLASNAGAGMIWGSPQSIGTADPSHHFWLSKLKRKNSQSSVNSVATLPLTSSSSAALAPTTSSNITATRERPRTLSHTSAALSSLAAAAATQQAFHHYGFGVPSFGQHTASRPPSPPLAVMFPPPPKPVHTMLPPALLASHSSATAYQRTMAQSLMRIGKTRAEKAA